MAQWIIDTRRLGKDRECILDGYVHVLPKAKVSKHVIDLSCWCEPRVAWPENGHTLIVSHRDRKQKTK